MPRIAFGGPTTILSHDIPGSCSLLLLGYKSVVGTTAYLAVGGAGADYLPEIGPCTIILTLHNARQMNRVFRFLTRLRDHGADLDVLLDLPTRFWLRVYLELSQRRVLFSRLDYYFTLAHSRKEPL